MTSSINSTPTTPTKDKNITVNFGSYVDTEMVSTKKKTTTGVYGLRVSSLQETLRKSVAKMNKDKNGEGGELKFNNEEEEEVIVQAAVDNNSLVSTTTRVNNRTVKVVIVGSLCVFLMLLVGCVFGASIAIARLTKEIEIDSLTGIMYSKESNNSDHSHQTTMKTEDVVIYSNMDTNTIINMTNEELKTLKEILLPKGDVKFQIQGYARGKDNTEIGLLVQGGTIIYDNEGLASATGDAKILLDLAYYGSVQEAAQDQEEEDGIELRRRYLATGCSGVTQVGQGSSGGASNNNRSSY